MSNYLLERRKQKLGITTVTKEDLKSITKKAKKKKHENKSKNNK